MELVPLEEVVTREHLMIYTNDLEDLLLESEEQQLKESRKELEKHLTRLEKAIREITRMCIKLRMRELTIIIACVTLQEQHIVDQISAKITSWHE